MCFATYGTTHGTSDRTNNNTRRSQEALLASGVSVRALRNSTYFGCSKAVQPDQLYGKDAAACVGTAFS